LERTRSGEVDRGEEDEVATEVLRDSTFAGFEGRRADDVALGLEGFREAVFATAFLAGLTDLAFK
jgi:hypothetical protein